MSYRYLLDLESDNCKFKTKDNSSKLSDSDLSDKIEPKKKAAGFSDDDVVDENDNQGFANIEDNSGDKSYKDNNDVSTSNNFSGIGDIMDQGKSSKAIKNSQFILEKRGRGDGRQSSIEGPIDLTKVAKVKRMLFGIASKEEIIAQSYGEVTRSETISYRTFKPEKGGLFCASIFGPIRNYECLCGKFKRMKYIGVICDRCGVEVTKSSVRRERMGHIALKAPVAHIWFVKSLPSKLANILDISTSDLDSVLYYSKYIVVDPGITDLQICSVLSEENYQFNIKKFGHSAFKALMGAEAVKIILEKLDLGDVRTELLKDFAESNSESKKKKIVKRLRIITDLLRSGNKPSNLILDVIPVTPPELRPLVMLDGGRFAASDLNEMYKKVINRNLRLGKLTYLSAPDIVIKNEKRMLQESVDALIDNGGKAKVIKGNKRPLKSLSDMLKGKQGRLRQNLLGKRVDYSGRSVIVVGASLKLNQFGLPKKMALELFKPFVYSKLEMYGIASTIKMAKRIVESESKEVWDILDSVIKEHPVMLNRAPTLHRLGIQAFEPILIEGKAIQLHPLVCAAFNADFDGDQMAVHVPLSLEAQLECRILMMSVSNILNPANGKPMVIPTQDIVLGLYYLSLERELKSGERLKIFGSVSDVESAVFSEVIDHHTPIIFLNKNSQDMSVEKVHTTAGRVIIYDLLPKNYSFSIKDVNSNFDQKFINNLIMDVYKKCGDAATVEFVDKLKDAGFEYATISSISFGKSDLIVPQSKEGHVRLATKEIEKLDIQYQEGLITLKEKYNKSIDVWANCTEVIAKDMMSLMSKSIVNKKLNPEVPLNSVFAMIDSGARGSPAQLKQLAGMRGLMSKPNGAIILNPIISNFIGGLNVIEYFISTHGARKGLSDTALKTANSGYLTRRLVDVAQECVITSEDCETDEYLNTTSIIESSDVVSDVSESIAGRFAAKDIFNLVTGELIVKAGELIDANMAVKIRVAGLDTVSIRSPVFCKAKSGICVKCYGIDLSTGRLAELGESVGVIAAQSIGEPGTQLTMRTFHIGGAATRSAEISNISAHIDGRVSVSADGSVINSSNDKIVMSRACEIILYSEDGRMHSKYSIPYGAKIFVSDQDNIKAGDKIADWDPYSTPIIAEKSGIASYKDIIDSVSADLFTDDTTGMSSRVIIDWRKNQRSQYSDLRPSIVLKNDDNSPIILPSSLEASYYLPVGAFIKVQDGKKVNPGDVIASITRETSKTRDITGGLPKVIELFEARKPKECAILSDIDGYVEFGKDCRLKRKIIVRPAEPDREQVEYLVSRNSHVTVSEGAFVKKGEALIDGSPDPHDVLRINGIHDLIIYMLHRIQKVYKLQGVTINDKHIEIILRQMTRKVMIIEPASTSLLSGELLTLSEFENVVKSIPAGDSLPTCSRVLLGVTKVGLQTDSPIAAASFQETVKVLTDAAFAGKSDSFASLKENVIVGGRLIPAGTGYVTLKMWDHARKVISVKDVQ